MVKSKPEVVVQDFNNVHFFALLFEERSFQGANVIEILLISTLDCSWHAIQGIIQSRFSVSQNVHFLLLFTEQYLS